MSPDDALRAYGLIRTWGPTPPPPPGHSWESLMERALCMARGTASSEEVPVGALVVDAQGRILGAARNEPVQRHDPSAHAEIQALRKAAEKTGNYRLGGCIMVVTLEPCLMCTGAIVHARLDGVVYGAANPATGAVMSCLNGLDLPFHNHRVWHYGGVCSASCAAMLREFFQQRRQDGNAPSRTESLSVRCDATNCHDLEPSHCPPGGGGETVRSSKP